MKVSRIRSLIAVALSCAAGTLVLALPSAASAFFINQCGGSSITGEGGGLQSFAEGTWTAQFNVSPNPDACNGTQGTTGTPSVTYHSTGGAAAAAAWGTNEEFGTYPFISKGFPPTEAATKKLEGVAKFPARAGTLLTIPVAQTAIAVLVHLPTGCTATSTPASGRLVLTNATLEQLLRGTITTWTAISDSGDSVSGGSCNAATKITRVVPKEPSDPEAIVKKYLYLIDNAKVWKATKTWRQIAEVTKWPEEAAAPIKRELNVAGYVAEHASTLGISWIHLARAQFGAPGHGAGTTTFWAEVQDGKNSSEEPIYADPSSNGDSETDANSNCKETIYKNAGNPLPTAAQSWGEVSATPEEPHYTLCGLSYVLALSSYSAYTGAKVPPTEEEARTVHDYLSYVDNIEPNGGQPTIGTLGTDYGKLPPEIFNIARPGTSAINW